MNKKIMIICLTVLGLVILSGCNNHSADWDRESCRIAGYEEPIKPDHDNIIKCRDERGSLEVGIHYEKLEILRKFPDTKIQVDYIRKIGKGCNEHKAHHKDFEIINCVGDKKLIKSWSSPACVDWCNERTEKGYNMCKANCKLEGYVCI